VAPEFLEASTHRQVGFDRGVPLFTEHKTPASEVKEKSAHRLMSHRMNLDGNLDPAGRLGGG
jgi:hypothetical protein